MRNVGLSRARLGNVEKWFIICWYYLDRFQLLGPIFFVQSSLIFEVGSCWVNIPVLFWKNNNVVYFCFDFWSSILVKLILASSVENFVSGLPSSSKLCLTKVILQVGLTFCLDVFAVENFVSGLHYSSKLPTLPLLRFIFPCTNTFISCSPHCTIVLLIWLILLCLFILTDSRRGSV